MQLKIGLSVTLLYHSHTIFEGISNSGVYGLDPLLVWACVYGLDHPLGLNPVVYLALPVEAAALAWAVLWVFLAERVPLLYF